MEEGGKARKTGKCYSLSSLDIGRRIVPGAEPSLHFSALGRRPLLLLHLALLHAGEVARGPAAAGMNESAPMQNGSGTTGVEFKYPLFCHGRHLIPVCFGKERRKMYSSFSD